MSHIDFSKKRKTVVIHDKVMLREYTDELLKYRSRGLPVITDAEANNTSAFDKERPIEVGCVGFALDDYSAVVYPMHARVGEKNIKVSPRRMMEEGIKPIYENSNLVGHFEKLGYVLMIATANVWGGKKINSENGFYADTGLMSYALNENKGMHGLDVWAKHYNVRMPDYWLKLYDYLKSAPKPSNYNFVPGKILYPYNGDDCIATHRLFFYLKKKLKKLGLWKMPLKFPLMWHFWSASMMELEGLNIGLEQNDALKVEFQKRINAVDGQLYTYPQIKQLLKDAKQEIFQEIYDRVSNYKNPPENKKKKVLELYQNALDRIEKKGEKILSFTPDVKRKLVFDVLGYESLAKTDSGLDSTEKWIFEELLTQRHHPKENKVILRCLVERSVLESSLSKYINPIPRWVGPDGRSHTEFKPQGTVTGRPSSARPNHNNLPKRYELAMLLRSQFISRGPDYVLLEADKKHAELRLIADRSEDKVLIKEFNDGKDPHKMAAAGVNGIPESEVTKEQRTEAKNAVSFGLIYGREAYALALDFGWTEKQGEEFKRKYFSKYHGVRDYLEDRKEYILKHGEVISHFGRHRRLPEVWDDKEGTRNAAVREGINAPIQGDAVDVVWTAGHRMMKWLFKHKMKSRVIIKIHDAIVIDAYKKELERVIKKLAWFMRDQDFIEKMTGWRCCVKFDIDVSVGRNLGMMKELEADGRGGFILPEKL